MPDSVPCTVVLPDLIGMYPWTTHVNPLERIVSPEAIRWLDAPGTLTTQKQRVAHKDINAGLLACLSWPDVSDLEKLQLVADYINWGFHMDDLTDEIGEKDAESITHAVMGPIYAPEEWKLKIDRGEARTISVLIHDLWSRLVKHAHPLVQDRFIHFLDRTFTTAAKEAMHRKQYYTPTMAEYEPLRRDCSAIRPTWAMVEYMYDIELPVKAWYHPVVRKLDDWANDLASWANDILSFAMEYRRGDTWNIVIVVMKEKELSIQEAMDFCGNMFRERIEAFVRARATLPSWDVEVDRAVQLYVDAMQSFVAGTIEFSFCTKRYFEDGMKVKLTRVVEFQHPKWAVMSASA